MIKLRAASLAIALSLFASVAAAQAPAPQPPPSPSNDKARAEAERLTAQGARAYQRGEYAVALEHFRRSYEVFPSPNTHSNIARALLKLGRLPEAMEELEAFLGDANTASDEARNFALQQKTELAAQLGKLTIDCDVDGAEVAIDGHPAGATPLQHARWVVPGAHTVTIALSGQPEFKESLQIHGGELRAIHASFRAPQNLGTPPPMAMTAPNQPPPATPPPTGPRPAPYRYRFMANLKLGFAPIIYGGTGVDQNPLYFNFTLELGVALCCNRQLYLVFPFGIQYKNFDAGSETVIEVPIGVQYDVHLVAGLYLPVQLVVGYAAVIDSPTENATTTVHEVLIRPTAGLKYVIAGRGNVGIDIFSLPVVIATPDGHVVLQYRLMFYGGINF